MKRMKRMLGQLQPILGSAARDSTRRTQIKGVRVVEIFNDSDPLELMSLTP